MRRSLVAEDLSNGAEAFKLRVVNQYNDEVNMVPFGFEYIGAIEEVVVVLPKGGELPKMKLDKACTCKSACTNECHYDIPNMMLRACHEQCACNSQTNPCAVARFTRPSTRFQVFYTQNKGWSLQTLEDIKPRQALFEYVGVLSMDQGQKFDNDDYIFAFHHGPHRYLLNAHSKGNLARFVNHSCRPNCCPMLVESSAGGLPRVLIYSMREIYTGEELVMDYGEDWWLAKADTVRGCCCGSEECMYDKNWCARIAPIDGVPRQLASKAARKSITKPPRPAVATMEPKDLDELMSGHAEEEEEDEIGPPPVKKCMAMSTSHWFTC